MTTHNICFRGEIRKILTRYPLLSRPMVSFYYAPAIPRMVERAYSVTPVRPSAFGVSNLRLSFSGGGIRVLWTHF